MMGMVVNGESCLGMQDTVTRRMYVDQLHQKQTDSYKDCFVPFL